MKPQLLALAIAIVLTGCLQTSDANRQANGDDRDSSTSDCPRASVYGIITNPKAEPVHGAKVVGWREGGAVATDYSDNRGCYALAITPGKVQLEFDAECYANYDDTFVEATDAGHRHDQVLDPEGC